MATPSSGNVQLIILVISSTLNPQLATFCSVKDGAIVKVSYVVRRGALQSQLTSSLHRNKSSSRLSLSILFAKADKHKSKKRYLIIINS